MATGAPQARSVASLAARRAFCPATPVSAFSAPIARAELRAPWNRSQRNIYTGRWKRRAAPHWARGRRLLASPGYHGDVAYFIKERAVSFIGDDGPNDVQPTGLPLSIGIPLHELALVAMGGSIFDNLDFERAVEQARRLNRYEFLFVASPLLIEKGTGSPLSPLAVF